MTLPSPKAVSLFLLATAGSIYGLFEALTSISDTDSFLSSPFVSTQPSTEDSSVLETQPNPVQKPEPIPITTPPTPAPISVPSSGASPQVTTPSPSATVEVGLENTNTGATVTVVPEKPSSGTSPTSTTKIDKPDSQPTNKQVVVSDGKKPSPTPAAKPAPPSRSTTVRTPSAPKPVVTKPKNASSAKTKNSVPLSISHLSDLYYKRGSTPTSTQVINANGEDEYDIDEVRNRFGRSSWDAMWIQYIDYMLLAPNKSKVWQEQAEKMKGALDHKAFIQYFDPSTQTLNIPLFGRFYLKERYPLNGRQFPADPYMVPWNGENLAASCKSLTDWTPTGAYLMTAREEIWHAAWNFCVKPSKIAKGVKPNNWWYS